MSEAKSTYYTAVGALLLLVMIAVVGYIHTTEQTRPADVEKTVKEYLAVKPADVKEEVERLEADVRGLRADLVELKAKLDVLIAFQANTVSDTAEGVATHD